MVNGLGGVARGLLRVACHAASPLAGSEMCLALAGCEDAPDVVPTSVLGVDEVPSDVLYVEPGINVDNRWMARIGVVQRGLDGEMTSDQAFELAYGLALRASCQWLHILSHVVAEAGFAPFWQDAMTRGVARADYISDTGPWERFDQIPYRFISAGAYPPALDPPDTAQWFLRLAVSTADVAFAGTNADLVAFVNGTRVEPLDQGPKPAGTEVDALLGLDDHERGTTTAYYLGPFAAMPTSVGILNDAPDGLDVIEAAGRSIVNAVTAFFGAVAGFFLGLVGAAADDVGQAHEVIPAATLEALPAGETGPSRCAATAPARASTSSTGESRPRRSSAPTRRAWHGASTSSGSTTCCARRSPSGTASRRPTSRSCSAWCSRTAGLRRPCRGGPSRSRTWIPASGGRSGVSSPTRVPRRFGFLSVAVAVYESDDESPGDRDALLNAFAGNAATATAPAGKQFGLVLAEAAAASWRPQRIAAAAFRRGTTAQVVHFAPFDPNRWVGGGEQLDWTLQEWSATRWTSRT